MPVASRRPRRRLTESPGNWLTLVAGLAGLLWMAGCATSRLAATPSPHLQLPWPATTTLADVERRIGRPHADWPGVAQYPNTDAVDLLRVRQATLQPTGEMLIHEEGVVKVLTEHGKPYGQIVIPFDAKLQTVHLRWAQTIRSDGTIVPLARDAANVVAPFESLTAFSSSHMLILSMPSVEAGAVLDYGYDLTTQPSFMGAHLWDSTFLSAGRPVVRTVYTARVPTGKSLKWQTGGLTQAPTETREASTTSYTWSVTDLPLMELDSHSLPLRDALPWVSVSTVLDWGAVAQWWRQLVLHRVNSDAASQAWGRAKTEGLSDPREKLRTIFEGLQREIRYVALEFGHGGYEPHWAHEVFATRYGDCKDQVVLLLTMLQQAGISAGPALLRAATAGPLATETPSPGEFTHAIAWAEVNGERFWLDPAAGVLPLGEISPNDAGVQVLTVIPGGWRFQEIPAANPAQHVTTRTVTLTLQDDGACRGTVVIHNHGWPAVQLSLFAKQMKPEQIELLAQGTAREIATHAVATGHRFPDWTAISSSSELSVAFDIPQWLTPLDQDLALVMPPQVPVGLRGVNKVQRRTTWWWGMPQTFRDRCEITLPTGYWVKTLPTAYRYEDASCALRSTWSGEAQRLINERILVFKTRAIAPSDWPTFRSAYLAFERAAMQPATLQHNSLNNVSILGAQRALKNLIPQDQAQSSTKLKGNSDVRQDAESSRMGRSPR